MFEGDIFLVGGHNGEMPVKLSEAFRPSEEADGRGEWVELPPMLARRAYLSASMLDGKIYAIGGSADGRILNTFETFDPVTQQWEMWVAKPPMQTKRTTHASDVAEGRIYVTGGFDGIRDLRSVEVYDPKSNTWNTNTDNMHKCRSYHALVTCAGSIYAIGGQERLAKGEAPRAHTSVEAFELYCERWLPVPELSIGRIGPSAAVLRNSKGEEFIYVTGGSTGEEVLKTGEIFNPAEQKWEPMPDMTVPRLSHVSAFIDGRLYVIGGFDGKVALQTFECYDPGSKTWFPPVEIGARVPEVPAISYQAF